MQQAQKVTDAMSQLGGLAQQMGQQQPQMGASPVMSAPAPNRMNGGNAVTQQIGAGLQQQMMGGVSPQAQAQARPNNFQALMQQRMFGGR
jgi:hypothetical protein